MYFFLLCLSYRILHKQQARPIRSRHTQSSFVLRNWVWCKLFNSWPNVFLYTLDQTAAYKLKLRPGELQWVVYFVSIINKTKLIQHLVDFKSKQKWYYSHFKSSPIIKTSKSQPRHAHWQCHPSNTRQTVTLDEGISAQTIKTSGPSNKTSA